MEFKMLPVKTILLDFENPRIARILQMYRPEELKADQIALALGAGDTQEGENYTTFRSLKESIRTNGGLIHPIVVNRNAKGKYVAIEGNTRVQIYRDFQREGIKGDWSRIPAVVHRNLASKAIDAIRLQAHLVGPRPWDPYSKARYLNDLRSKKNLTMEQIVEFCGGRKKQVLDYIAAYQDMEQFYRAKLEPGESFDPTRFSAFVELQRPDVQQAVQAAGFSKGDFAKWVIDDLFGPLQTIRQLPRILGHNDAKVVFLRDGAQEAMKLLDVPPADTSLALASMTQIALELSRRISKLEFGDIQRLKSHPTGDERDVLLESRTRLEELFTLIADEGNG